MDVTFVTAMTLGSLVIISILVLVIVVVMIIPQRGRHR